MRPSRTGLVASLIFLWLVTLARVATAAPPKAELWDRWSPHSEANPVVVNHTAWESFLVRHLVVGGDGINRVRYAHIDGEENARLMLYLSDLARIPVSGLRRDEQRAYWINLYNASTVKLVADHYPLDTIREVNLSPGSFSGGPWDAQIIKVEDETLSLNDIEHRILRPIWKDPRIHYALCNATTGSPNLPPHAFTAASTEAFLDKAAYAFVNRPGAVRVEKGKAWLSSLYEWYEPDFGATDADVISHLLKYAEPALMTQLDGVKKIRDGDFDWALNDARDPVPAETSAPGSAP